MPQCGAGQKQKKKIADGSAFGSTNITVLNLFFCFFFFHEYIMYKCLCFMMVFLVSQTRISHQEEPPEAPDAELQKESESQ